MLSTTALAATARVRQRPAYSDEDNIFERVKEEVDLWKLLPPKAGDREFDRYYLTTCLSPDHPDEQQSLLVYHDGARCQACGFKGDAVDIYQMYHPEVGKRAAAVALLSGDYEMEGEPVKARTVRELDPSLATLYHLELARNAEMLARLEAFGFSRPVIQHFRLGLARIKVRLTEEEAEGREVGYWTLDGQQVPYQEQWRFSVPVVDGGLRQIIYRKADPTDPGPKTTMEKGAGTAYLFNGDVLKGAKYAVLTSGWGDAVVLSQWGLPAVSGIAGDGYLPDALLNRLRSISHLYAVTDADKAGEKLAARLQEKVPWVRLVRLPYEVGSKCDVRDFFLDGHTKQEFIALMRQAEIDGRFRALTRQ